MANPAGDDIGALVFDVGSYALRAGNAGDDIPKFEIPAVAGILEEGQNGGGDFNSPSAATNGNGLPKKYFIDINSLCVPRKDVKVVNYMKDGTIEDWDTFEQVMDYAYEHCLHVDPSYHPVLITESATNPRLKREKLTELMFEKYNVPSFFLTKGAVCAMYAAGKISALVVDSGATHTTVIPIHDGYVLSHGVVKSPLGGDQITRQCAQFFQENDIEIVPPYMVASKEQVPERQKPVWTKAANLPPVTPSWHKYATNRVLQDFQQTVLQVSETPYDEKNCAILPTVHYEFPNGYNQNFGHERFKLAEVLFDPPQQLGGGILGAGHIVTTSVGMCDVDLRPMLYSNMVITGGNSCITGFSERLIRDVQVRIPGSMRLKSVLPSNVSNTERKFGAWAGGSLLLATGAFHQVWISSQEYKDAGKSIVDRKCP